MMHVPDWNRQHTLMLVIMVVFAAGVYILGYLYVIDPLSEKATTQQEVLVQEPVEPPSLISPDVTEEEILATEQAIPRGSNPGDLLAIVEAIGKETGVSIDSVTASETAASDAATDEKTKTPSASAAETLPAGITGMPHTVTFSTDTIQNANAFLDGLNENPRYLRTDNLTISQENGVTVSVGVTAFSRP